MKIRLKGNSIRLRLTQSEVASLALGETVIETTQISLESQLSFSLASSSVTAISTIDQSIRIEISQALIDDWANSDHESISETVSNESSGLLLLVEKDFACLKPRIDETDQFPNPLSAASKC
jgi:hypothetical protein